MSLCYTVETLTFLRCVNDKNGARAPKFMALRVFTQATQVLFFSVIRIFMVSFCVAFSFCLAIKIK